MEGEIVKVSLIVLVVILFIRALSKLQEPPKTNNLTNQNTPKKSDEWWDDFFLYFLLLDLFSFKESEASSDQETTELQTNYLEWFDQHGVNAQQIDETVQRHNEEMEQILGRNECDSEDIDYDYEDSFGWDSDDSM